MWTSVSCMEWLDFPKKTQNVPVLFVLSTIQARTWQEFVCKTSSLACALFCNTKWFIFFFPSWEGRYSSIRGNSWDKIFTGNMRNLWRRETGNSSESQTTEHRDWVTKYLLDLWPTEQRIENNFYWDFARDLQVDDNKPLLYRAGKEDVLTWASLKSFLFSPWIVC